MLFVKMKPQISVLGERQPSDRDRQVLKKIEFSGTPIEAISPKIRLNSKDSASSFLGLSQFRVNSFGVRVGRRTQSQLKIQTVINFTSQ